MSATFVQYSKTTTGAGASSATSPSLTFTSGNLLVITGLVANPTNTNVTACTDTLGNTYHRLAASAAFNLNVFGGCHTEFWYAYNITGGTGTVTISWPSGTGVGFSGVYVVEYSASPVWGSSDPTDTSNGIAGSGTPLVNLTLAQANELVVGYNIMTSSAGWVWTNLTERGGGPVEYGDYQPPGSGSYNVTASGGSASQFVISAAAFKVPSGGGGGSSQPTIFILQ